ncbi:MAG: tetratricopeptide repeat protein, partial [Ignavibacteria bacterium]
MKKYFLLLFTSLLFLSCTKSTEELKLESDKLFNQAMDYYERSYLTKSAELFKKVIEIETKLGGIQRRANSYVYLGLINYQLSDFLHAMEFYQKALQDFRNQNDKRSELLVLNNIAGIHSLLGEYNEAIKIYSDVIGKSLIFADKESEAIASLNLGDVYQEMFDYDKAFDYFNKAFESYEVLGDVKGKIFTLNKIGELFISSKNFPNAIKSFDMAFEIQNKSGINYLSQQLYNNIGLIYFYENQIQKAKEFFETAFNLKTTSETNQLTLIAIRNNLGDCEFQSGSYSKALDYYKEALALSEQSFLKFLSPILQLKIARSLEKLYFINHNDTDKKSAERFYQFAINRFEENRDEENLSKALTLISSFYTRINERKKAENYFEKLEDLKINLSLKPDENLRAFALK